MPLELRRYEGESVTIGGGITVRVDRIRRGRVTLSIDAPQSIRIDRTELLPEQPELDRHLDDGCPLEGAVP